MHARERRHFKLFGIEYCLEEAVVDGTLVEVLDSHSGFARVRPAFFSQIQQRLGRRGALRAGSKAGDSRK